MPSIAEFELPASTVNAIGATRTRDDVEQLVKAVLLNERERCRKIVQWARETGNDDLRGIIASIVSGDSAETLT